MFVAGSGIYDKCGHCSKLVKLNKWLFGSMHVCLTDEEIKQLRAKRKQK